MRFVFLLLGATSLLVCAIATEAHDASAWGGLFRSRDFGANWLPADPGLYISGALSIGIHPQDPARLLYGTDTRFMMSGNGGRDWANAGGTDVLGGVFAVAYDTRGEAALAATSSSLYRTDDFLHWKKISLPSGAAPLKTIVDSATTGRIYAAGWRGILRSDDAGQTWQAPDEQLPEGPVTSLVSNFGRPELLYAVVDGQVWESGDGAHNWRQQSAGIAAGSAQAMTVSAGRIWLAAANQIFALGNDGNWVTQGRPLPERDTSVRGLAVSDSGKLIVLSTHRGVYRSADAGLSWQLIESALPVHLESGPLMRDPHDSQTLYVGFAIQPYDELWRRARQGTNLLSELSAVSLAGALAFLALLLIGGAMLVRWLIHLPAKRN